MSSEVVLRGVYVPLVTPFAADGSVALEAIRRLAHEYLDAGAAGLVPLGTTGESPALDAAEKRAVVDVCSRVCVDRGAPMIVGAGTNNTTTTIAAVRALEGVPALAATLIVVPYYVRPSEAGIVAHYQAVAAASPVPVVLYNIPYRTGRGIGSASILELARTPNIAGIKQAVGGIDADTLRVLAEMPEGFSVLGGEDPYLYPTVLLGGSGAIAASAHVCTERFVAMIECGLAGKLEEGRAYEEALLPVIEACFAEPNPAVFKGVLHAQGRIPTPDLRLPLLPASATSIDRALAAIDAVG
jgi:4-hydroxy-tetrahydrodipicolinate synthase